MSKKLPLVSVITCTYNIVKAERAEYIRQCFSSIHNQTYPEIEHIVIDGASSDGTVDILEDYSKQGKLKYYSEPDNGIYDAMNKGILKAKGKYIVFMNSDDFYNRLDAVEQAVKVLENENADFCGGNTFFLDEKNPVNSHYRYANLHQVFTLMPFCHQTMFCRRSVMLKENMFDVSFKSAGDYDFIIRLYLKGYKGAVVPLTYVTFRVGGESFSNYQVSHQECLYILDKYFGNYYRMNKDECHQWLYQHRLPVKLEHYLETYLKDKKAFNIPKITIITACFNIVKAGRVESFKNCMESVHKQNYPNIEHLIIDGASTDGTVKLLREYAKKGWIKYISEPDKGIYDAMQKGVYHASGEYCYFLNSDDHFFDDNVVSDVMEYFEDTQIDACFGDLFPYLIDEKAPYVKVFEINKPASFADITDKASLLRRNIHHQTIFYNKKIFYNSSFFDDKLPQGSDCLLHCQAFIRNNYTFKHIDRIITCFNMGGVSTNANNNPIEECMAVQKYLCGLYGSYIENTQKKVVEVKKKKVKFGPIVLLRIREKNHCKKVYLFNFLPLLTIKKKKNKKKFYLFGVLLVYRKKDYKKIICNCQKQLKIQQAYFETVLAEKENALKKLQEKVNQRLIELSDKLSQLNIPEKDASEYLKSFSQAGEDKVIDFIFFYFTNVDRSQIRYLDIGANYPIDNNNTYFYYLRNGKGVLVEPNKELCAIAESKRSHDTIINAGIKFSDASSSEYYTFDECGLNTFDASRVENITAKGHKLIGSYTVPLISINDILRQYFSSGVDFISIDAEGVDIAILKTIDFELCRPTLFCVEANKNILNRKAKSEVIEFLENKNYVLMADTSINYIFLAREALILNKYC